MFNATYSIIMQSQSHFRHCSFLFHYVINNHPNGLIALGVKSWKQNNLCTMAINCLPCVSLLDEKIINQNSLFYTIFTFICFMSSVLPMVVDAGLLHPS